MYFVTKHTRTRQRQFTITSLTEYESNKMFDELCFTDLSNPLIIRLFVCHISTKSDMKRWSGRRGSIFMAQTWQVCGIEYFDHFLLLQYWWRRLLRSSLPVTCQRVSTASMLTAGSGTDVRHWMSDYGMKSQWVIETSVMSTDQPIPPAFH